MSEDAESAQARAGSVEDEQAAERGRDAVRKRIRMLHELLRELDMAVYTQLLAVYHLDCSFFWLAVRALVHASLLTPAPDKTLQRPPDEPRPFLPLLLFACAAPLALHLARPAPAAGEDTRGYLHGGLVIDFIGQRGPTPRWRLAALDLCLLGLQLAMVAVHVKRRELKRRLALAAGDNAALGQGADDEERGVLRRADSQSDLGADGDGDSDGDGDGDDESEDQGEEEDEYQDQDQHTLLPSPHARGDALDALTSGQCVIGDFTLVDTLLAENKRYAAHRLTRSESASVNDMPETLRRLNTLRTRLGVGGG